MVIGLKIIWTLRIMPRHQSTVRSLTMRVEQWHGLTTRFEQSTGLNSDAVWLKIILCICMYSSRDFWSTNMLPRHRSTVHKNFLQLNRDTSSVNATSLVNATSSFRMCEQYREQYHGQYRTCEQCHFFFYAPPKVFDYLESKGDIRFVIVIVKWPWCP